MPNIKEVLGINSQPQYWFTHNEKDYFIYAWLEGGTEKVYSLCLAEPRTSSNPDAVLPNNKLSVLADEDTVNSNGGAYSFMESEFLPRVNQWLIDNGGADLSEYPENGSHMEQFNWLVNNSLSYNQSVITID